jgi:tetraacyldisaccharide 4'-kinase
VKFFHTLDAIGCNVVGTRAFADHYPFRGGDLSSLFEEADALEARLVTTEKDAVRLPPPVRARVEVLRIHAAFDDAQALDAVLAPVLP